MINRLFKYSKSNSFFIFGNRGVGKSTYLEAQFPRNNHLWIDLLNSQLFKKLVINPHLFQQILDEEKKSRPKGSVVIIDEIQKIPELLDIVHSEIERKHFLFILTGSSARKLKKAGVNLLAGRAFIYHMFPFTHKELDQMFDLNSVLRWGSLPKIFSFDNIEDKIDYLNSYCDSYLREEIIAEQIVRNVTPFRHFLEVASQSNSKIINFSNIAKSVGVDTSTVQNYFQILEDTFTGVLLQPFHESIRERQRKNPKFYYFDMGVTRSLQNRLTLPIVEQSFEFGDLFEQFIILEFIRLNSYLKKSWKFSYMMTKNNVEIDLIIERPGLSRLLIEIKSTDSIQSLPDSTLVGFRNLVRDFKNAEGLCVSRDPVGFVKEGVRFIHWMKLFEEVCL